MKAKISIDDQHIADIQIGGFFHEHTPIIPAINEDIEEALGPAPEDMTPGNKFWLLKQMLFKSIGKGLWTHPTLGTETVVFDLESDSINLIIGRIYRKGYKAGVADDQANEKNLREITNQVIDQSL